jgi:hypothetical protein
MYKEIIIDAVTGKETKIKFTPQELVEFEAKQSQLIAEAQIKELELLEKAKARSAAEAKLLALGLTTEDLKALLG